MFIPLAHVVELEDTSDFRWRFAGILLGGLLLVAYWQQWVTSPFQWDLAIALTFIFGYRTFSKAFRDITSRRISADQAVMVAALAALYVGEYLAAAEVVYIMLVGETIEEYTAQRFRSDLKSLLSCIPHHAHVLRDGVETEVHVEEIQPGEQVIVYPGQRIPVDGKILAGESLIDESSITGESLPRERLAGETVYAGTLNESSRLILETSDVGESTVLSRIVHLVQEAKENKAPIQRTADRYAQWFLPLVLGIAIACYFLTGDVMRSVAILIVACPCAMVLATPAAVLASVGFLARRGVIVKGGIQLEKLAEVDCLALDKTGTVTKGRPELVEIRSFNGPTEEDVLARAASLESHSEHLLATAIRNSAEERQLKLYAADQVERHAGLGMEGILNIEGPKSPGGPSKERILVGSARFFEKHGFEIAGEAKQALEDFASQGTISVLVGQENRQKEIVGILVMRDSARPEAAKTLHRLRHLGIQKSLLLTGDNENAAKEIARSVGISEVHANLLPEEKLNRLDDVKRQGYTVAMVGDGVNDSPSLAAADVGIAMGDTGTDIAAEAAGVVLMGDEGLARIPDLIRASRRAVKTIQDNIFWFGFAINLAAVLAAFFGYLTAIAAAVLHQITSFLVLMNSLRLLSDKSTLELPHRLHHLLDAQKSKVAEIRDRYLTFRFLSVWLSRHRREVTGYLVYGLSTLYVASGFALITPDETALVTRFGKVVDEPLTPGVHYRLPWPFERLHRLHPQRVQAMEVGFRTAQESLSTSEPPAYEWNIQHRQGRYQRESDEAQMLTGDEYLLEVNAVIQFAIENAKQYLFQTTDVVNALRAVVEGGLRKVVATQTLDQVLAIDRAGVERAALQQIRHDVERLGLGVKVHSVNFQDVHPALEVVGAFREVASSMEEKSRMINQAQAYANERFPLARGESEKRLIDAEAYQLRRTNRALGEAERFTARDRAYRSWPRTTSVRLYLETVDQVLPNKTKYILDETSGRRKLMLFENSVFPVGDLQKSIEQIQRGDGRGVELER